MTTNVALVEELYAAFRNRDMDRLRAGFHDDIQWTVSDRFPYAGTYTGFDAILAGVFGRVADDWTDFRHDLTGVIDCGADVLAKGTYLGTWNETGRPIQADFIHHWHIEDGRVRTFRQYVDVPATIVATDGFEHRATITL